MSAADAFINLIESAGKMNTAPMQSNKRKVLTRQLGQRNINIDIKKLVIEKQNMFFNLLEKMNKYAKDIVTRRKFDKKGREIYKNLKFMDFNRSMIKTSETDEIGSYRLTDIEIRVYNYSLENGPNNVKKREFLYNSNTDRAKIIAFKIGKRYIGVADFLDDDFRKLLVTEEEKMGFNDIVKLTDIYMKIRNPHYAQYIKDIKVEMGEAGGSLMLILSILMAVSGGLGVFIGAALAGAIVIAVGAYRYGRMQDDFHKKLLADVENSIPFFTHYRHPGTSIMHNNQLEPIRANQNTRKNANVPVVNMGNQNTRKNNMNISEITYGNVQNLSTETGKFTRENEEWDNEPFDGGYRPKRRKHASRRRRVTRRHRSVRRTRSSRH
jgi:hypothetical protein